MTIIGEMVEQKTIGINLELNGTNVNTELVNGVLQLSPTIRDGVVTYPDTGEWISEIIDIGDNFNNYDKLLLNQNNEGNSSVRIFTRSSSDRINFNTWTEIDSDNNILSQKNRYIQVMILFTSDSTIENLIIDNSKFESDYSEINSDGDLVLKSMIEYDMIKDETWSDDGELHRKLVTRSEWNRIDKLNVLRK